MDKYLIKMGCVKAPISDDIWKSLLGELIESTDEDGVPSMNLTQVEIPFIPLKTFDCS